MRKTVQPVVEPAYKSLPQGDAPGHTASPTFSWFMGERGFFTSSDPGRSTNSPPANPTTWQAG